jgi:mitotic spindle assembly checkpoint protein MAD1
MQGELLRAQQQLADARADLGDAQARSHSAAAERAAAAAAAARAQGEAELQARKLRLAEGRLAILQTEAEGLKKIVAILEQDAAGGDAGGGGGDQGGGGGAPAAAAAAARAEALAAELEQARAQLTAAEALAAAAAEGEARQRVRAEEAEAAAKAFEREAEDSGREVARLQACVAAGDFNPATTRVLHMAANPASERRRADAEAAVARLQAEVSSLRRLLRDARGAAPPGAAAAGGEGGGGGGGEGGGAAAAPAPVTGDAGVALAQKEAELAMAQRQVAQLSRQEARLRELFADNTKAFRCAPRRAGRAGGGGAPAAPARCSGAPGRLRPLTRARPAAPLRAPSRSEAVRCLFGYRVDMQAAAPGSTKGALVALRPDGAAAKGAGAPGDRDPQLQFRFTPATGRLELLPTPLARSLAKEVSTFIERFASVPAFTANLTMDLFQKAAAASGGA